MMQEIQQTKIVYSNHKNFLHITRQCILIKIMKKNCINLQQDTTKGEH